MTEVDSASAALTSWSRNRHFKVDPEFQPLRRFVGERLGYFTPDPDSTPDHLVFNRTLTLKDTWAKVQARDR